MSEISQQIEVKRIVFSKKNVKCEQLCNICAQKYTYIPSEIYKKRCGFLWLKKVEVTRCLYCGTENEVDENAAMIVPISEITE